MSDAWDKTKLRAEVNTLWAERDALRAELAAVRKQHDANGKASRDRAEHIYKLRTKLNAAEAERDKLREVLRKACNVVYDGWPELLARALEKVDNS